MIKFFRRVRLRLLENGRLRNYFLYAAGEIILVVVGILIALQINNWNEDRKGIQKEGLILREMLNSLHEDSISLSMYIERLQASSKASKNLLAFPELTDSLSIDFMNAIATVGVTPKTAGFEQLKSSGLDIVRNDSLRQAIVNYYDVHVKRVQMRIQSNLGEFNSRVMLPFFYEHFKMEASDTSFYDLKYIPKSYPDLIKNPDYYTTIVFKYIYNEQEKTELVKLHSDNINLMVAIRDELEKRW